LPVSSSVFRLLRTKDHPPPVFGIEPPTSAAAAGAPSSSWVSVRLVTPSVTASSVSKVRRAAASAVITPFSLLVIAD
jgi:hypothetical protein